jgi:hypothetical protein
MWMIAGIAGGIQPWWHHVGAYHDDRRMYRTAEPYLVSQRAVSRILPLISTTGTCASCCPITETC